MLQCSWSKKCNKQANQHNNSTQQFLYDESLVFFKLPCWKKELPYMRRSFHGGSRSQTPALLTLATQVSRPHQ